MYNIKPSTDEGRFDFKYLATNISQIMWDLENFSIAAKRGTLCVHGQNGKPIKTSTSVLSKFVGFNNELSSIQNVIIGLIL